ncbi:MAG: 1-deoxy-D-xylulose-5-phosphate reductoisomerase [Bacteroidetes bacterium]|nr:MAG: 1-deoxy-D-xylulose-5-phosphate reductoisomerase [Bacteroidota bacterium]
MGKTKNICILGSTGSIGKNSLEVIARFPELFRPASLTTNSNIDLLEQQIARFKPQRVGVLNESAASELKKRLNGSVEMFCGAEGLQELARAEETDILINSLVGFAGLKPTIEAIKKGKTVALANKETLVVAGELITALIQKHHATLIPIDSEHSAILQCLAGENPEHISRLMLTASGGPFLHLDNAAFETISVEAALQHPNWNMGNKITIDSATLMNKGLEVIEAHWLFNLPLEKIEVVIHPQSIIHSMVEFIDGSVKAQLGIPDMKLPIQYALTYPERLSAPHPRIDFVKLREMTFFAPDTEKFPCLRLAYDAMRKGGTAPAIMNAANEIAVELFLKKRIGFTQIPRLIEQALEAIPVHPVASLESVIEADSTARKFVLSSFNSPRL